MQADLYTRDVILQKPKQAAESARLAMLSTRHPRTNPAQLAEKRFDEIRSLRQTQNEKPNESKPAVEIVRDFFQSVVAALAIAKEQVVAPVSRMCVNYGHKIDHSTWKTGLPHCIDCGSTIQSNKELRKSMIDGLPDKESTDYWIERADD